MYSLTDIGFWLSLVAIFCSFIVAFYIPGRVLLADASITKLRVSHALSVVVGAVFWAWQAYIFAVMGMRNLSYGYLLVFIIIFIKKGYFKKPTRKIFTISSFDPIALTLIIVGVIAQTFPYLRMGIKVPEGIIIAAHNPDDHIWHAGLIRELISRFPAHEPGMSGVLLKDYHYWFNLLTAELIRVFHLPALQTQFIGMYVLAAVLLGIISYSFAHYLYPSKLFTRLFIFFLFFSGDIAGWYMLVLHKAFTMNLSSLINNGTKFLDSPAFALSIITTFTGLYLLFYHKDRLSKHIIILCAFLFSSLLEFKVYTGITIMLGFAVFAVYGLFKKQYDRVVVFLLSSALGAAVFFPGTSSSGGLFFLPFDIPRDFVTQSVLGLRDWGLRWRIYQDHANYIRIIQYGLYMTGVYFLIQFGAQLIGLIPLAKTRKILGNDRFIFLYTSVCAGIVLSLFFYQKVGGANIWEFLLPAGIILSLLTSLTLSLLLEKRRGAISVLVISLVVLLVLPRWIDSIRMYANDEYLTGFHGVDQETYLSYLMIAEFVSLDDVIVIVNHPGHVAYVSVAKALTEKSLFLSGEGVRQQDTPEILKRRAIVKKLQEGKVEEELSELKKYNVAYLYYYGIPPSHVEASRKLMV
jgi:hypothetical protein